jgi:hypothetical protein
MLIPAPAFFVRGFIGTSRAELQSEFPQFGDVAWENSEGAGAVAPTPS